MYTPGVSVCCFVQHFPVHKPSHTGAALEDRDLASPQWVVVAAKCRPAAVLQAEHMNVFELVDLCCNLKVTNTVHNEYVCYHLALMS